MKFVNDQMKDIKVAYIGGGSKGWAWTFMSDLALEPKLHGSVALYDIDYEAAKQNEIIGNQIAKNEGAVSKWKYHAVKTLKEALTDVDFVMISILPGTFDEMESDVHLPESLGIYQSVGDTVGPGGLIRGLRAIPAMVEIAHAIKKYAPEAWVINYTNPMSLCMQALYDVFPEIKAFGCCHEVFGTQDLLARMAEVALGIPRIERQEIKVNVLGINHFTWFDKATYKGVDLIPLYRKFVAQQFENGFNQSDDHWANSHFNSLNRVKFDLFQKYGYIAAAGDRHLAEFMPGDLYLENPEIVAFWNFGLTSVAWRKEDLEERAARGKRLVNNQEEFDIHQSGEEGILLMKALCGLEQLITNVNIPNTAKQIPNLPESAIVETNALFERDSVRPIMVGKMPDVLYELTAPHIKNQAFILEATKTYNKDLVVAAFMNDPLVKGRVSKEDVSQLVDQMIERTLTELPKKWQLED